MVVISKSILTEFGKKHADAIEPLNDWWKKVKEADWATFQDVKATFNSADAVGNDRYVFDIKGNKYRIVTMIFFDKRTMFIRLVDTHAKHDKIDCATI